MATNPSTLEAMASEFARVLEPLSDQVDAEAATLLLWELGLRAPPALTDVAPVATGLSRVGTAAAELTPLIAELLEALAASDDAGGATAAVLAKVGVIVEALRDVASAMDAASGTLAGLTTAQRGELSVFAAGFTDRVLQHLLVDHIERRAPNLATALMLAGGIELLDVEPGLPGTLEAAYTRKRVHPGRIVTLVSDPRALLRDVYGWGETSFDGLTLLRTLQMVLSRRFGRDAELLTAPGQPVGLEAFGFAVQVNDEATPPALDVSLRFPAEVDVNETVSSDGWEIPLRARAQFATDLDLTLYSPLAVQMRTPSANAELELAAEARRSASEAPRVLLGTANGNRLEASAFGGGIRLDTRWTTSSQVAADPELHAHVRGGRFVLADGYDQLLGDLLGDRGIEALFDADLTWSPSRGLRLGGGAAASIEIPVNASLGPVRVDAIQVGVGLTGGEVEVDVTTTLAAKFGPIMATLDRLGMRCGVRLAEQGGNLGPLDLDLAFKPPKGAGIRVDAGPVSGGGFLAIDADAGRYSGALQLRIYEVSVSAFGVIDTKLPSGEAGFSFVILICAEFTPIQLGLGFTLNGVGGAIGIHRTLSKEALDGAVRSGRLEHILFPKDPAARAPEIIRDLQAYFPPAQGRYTFGPLAKIGWGTPNVLEAKLGLILELPHPVRLTLLGTVAAGLPTTQKRFVKLNLAIVGQLDFDRKTFALDASLYDSDVGGFVLSGDAAVRLGWGREPSFALAIGGFNPQFQPPAGFPALRRVAVDIGRGGSPRVTCQAYLAITSNTLQVGARAELTAGGHWNIHGWIGFDALFEFQPFGFAADFSAGVALRQGTRKRASVTVHGTLKGPNPWYVKGRACIS
jgi:hypothetical protein